MKLKNIRIKNLLLFILIVSLIVYGSYSLVSGNEKEKIVEIENIEKVLVTSSDELYGLMKKGTLLTDEEGNNLDISLEKDVVVYYNGKKDIEKSLTVYNYVGVEDGKLYNSIILYDVEDLTYEEALFLVDTGLEMTVTQKIKVKNVNPNINTIDSDEITFNKGDKVYPLEVTLKKDNNDIYVKVANEKGKEYFVELKYLKK